MKVEWSAWVILAAVMYGVATCAGFGVRRWAKKTARSRSWRVGAPIATFVLVIAALNGLTYGISTDYYAVTPDVQATEVASEGFGLTSGKAYPLMAGSLVGSSDIKVQGNRTSINVEESSSSQLSLAFRSPDGSYYVATIPTGPIKFFVDEDPSRASVVMYLENPQNTEYNSGYGRQEMLEGPCAPGIQSGYLVCNRVREYRTVIPQWAKDNGLQAVVSKTFRRAVITLPCADFTALAAAKVILPVSGCG